MKSNPSEEEPLEFTNMAQEGAPKINRYSGKMTCGYQYFLYDNQEAEAILKEDL